MTRRGQVWCSLWLVLAGLFGTVAHMCWTRALQLGDASILTPISFMQVLVVGVFGWWLFGESVDRYTLIGALIIFGSNLYLAHREITRAKPAVTDPEIFSDTLQR
mgnify:FL=1